MSKKSMLIKKSTGWMDGGVLPRAILVHIVVSLLTNSETTVFKLRFSSGGCSPTRPWGYLIFLSLNVAPFIIIIPAGFMILPDPKNSP